MVLAFVEPAESNILNAIVFIRQEILLKIKEQRTVEPRNSGQLRDQEK